MPPIVSVAVGLWLHQRFDYAVPEPLQHRTLAGTRVLVPFGPRTVTGYVVAEKSVTDYPKKLREILEVLDESPSFNSELLNLLEWAATYYQVPLGDLLRKALPPSLHQADVRQVSITGKGAANLAVHPLLVRLDQRGPLPFKLARNVASEGQLSQLEQEGYVSVQRVMNDTGPKARIVTYVQPGPNSEPLRGTRQQQLMEQVLKLGRASVPHLRETLPAAQELVKKLVASGHLVADQQREFRTLDSGVALQDLRHPLNDEQQQAVATVSKTLNTGSYAPYLLHGITGSGKTEVYMHLVEQALAMGLASLILVPEIALTPQLMARFEARFDRKVAILHSALTPGERLDYWYQVANGSLPIVLGARSAIFAPVPNLGLIVVDEEHESSFKQDVAPFYNARDLALIRASKRPCTVVLGSATPSLETWHNAQEGKLTLLSLHQRATPRPLPDVVLVDLRTQKFADPDRIFSLPLATAISQTLDARQQTILFLNRKGFSQFILCERCGYVPHCDHCSVSLTYYKREHVLRCHYCQERIAVPDQCPTCEHPELKLIGTGTERVMESLAALFPEARAARVDAASGARTTVPRTLEAFRRGDLDILVGTQMIAKGHDFPNVTLVGVLQADQGLAFPDVRAAERTFQLVTQVAGRAGRGDISGRVFLQTYMPGHYSLVYAQRQDFVRFAKEELGVRSMRGMPPFTCFALYRFTGTDLGRVRQSAEIAKVVMEQHLSKAKIQSGFLLGPGPAAIAMLSDRHRYQLIVRTASRKEMQALLRSSFSALSGAMESFAGVQWDVDVDPMHIM